MDRRDLEALRRRAGNLRTRDIVRALADCGWRPRAGGKHPYVYKKPGRAFSITVQSKMTRGTAISIINDLLDDLDEEEGET